MVWSSEKNSSSNMFYNSLFAQDVNISEANFMASKMYCFFNVFFVGLP